MKALKVLGLALTITACGNNGEVSVEIPEKVQATIDREYSDYKIEKVEVEETINGTVYEFELEKDGERMEIELTPEGEMAEGMPETTTGDMDGD